MPLLDLRDEAGETGIMPLSVLFRIASCRAWSTEKKHDSCQIDLTNDSEYRQEVHFVRHSQCHWQHPSRRLLLHGDHFIAE